MSKTDVFMTALTPKFRVGKAGMGGKIHLLIPQVRHLVHAHTKKVISVHNFISHYYKAVHEQVTPSVNIAEHILL